MSKLSNPVAKALQALLKACKDDSIVVMRIITGNYNAHDYFFNLTNEINLLRCANFDDILIALVEGLPKAIKTTESPSEAAAVEGLEGILTEEELAKMLMNSSERDLTEQEIFKMYDSHRILLSANAELSFELMLHKKYEGFLRTVVRSGEKLEDEHDFEWFKEHSAIFHNKGAFK